MCPPAFCRAVCNGIFERIDLDRTGQLLIVEVSAKGDDSCEEMVKEAETLKHGIELWKNMQMTIWKQFGMTFLVQKCALTKSREHAPKRSIMCLR